MSPPIPGPDLLPWRLPPPDTWSPSPAYHAALARLYRYWETPRSPAEIARARVRKLDRARALLGLLGTPQARFATVLVAGTKGKGSMAALLASILDQAGYRVGRYTQPHLYSYRERTWAGGHYISEAELVDEVAAMGDALRLIEQEAADLGPLTTFDVGTAHSLLHFARARVEIAVVEVGVGGGGDFTNVIEPTLALIGPIGLDHTELLGPTLADIGREKAGITRRGVDVVVAPQEPEARAAIHAVVTANGARLHQLESDAVRGLAGRCDGAFTVATRLGTVDDLRVPLLGRYQRENTAMAVAAAQVLAELGWTIPETAVRQGVAGVHWPGRFQPVVRAPFTVVDGAHDALAARALAATVRECLPGRRITLVLGMSAEKDAPAFLAELAPLAARVVVTRARHPRACDPASLHALVQRTGLATEMAPSAGEALRAAWAAQNAGDVTLLTGSLFLVGDALEWLLGERGTELP